jgi:hypothetical protein
VRTQCRASIPSNCAGVGVRYATGFRPLRLDVVYLNQVVPADIGLRSINKRWDENGS